MGKPESRLLVAMKNLKEMLVRGDLSQCRQSMVRMTTNPKTGEKIISRIVQEPKP